MTRDSAPKPKDEEHAKAVQHLAEAHQLLKHLHDRLNEHPELELAIVKLETALSILTVKTGGML